jgi:hypothetical protein
MEDKYIVEKYEDIPLENILYNQDENQFYTKYKRKEVVEVDDIKPIKWHTVKTNYQKRDGSVNSYVYKYANLNGHQVKERDMQNAILYMNPTDKSKCSIKIA